MRVTLRHNTSRQQAKETVQALLPELLNRFAGSVSNPQVDWHNDTADFSGQVLLFSAHGTLRISDAELNLDIDGLPFFAHGRVRRVIETWFDENWPPKSE